MAFTNEGNVYDPNKYLGQSQTRREQRIGGMYDQERGFAQDFRKQLESDEGSLAYQQMKAGLAQNQQQMAMQAAAGGANPLAQRSAVYAGGQAASQMNQQAGMMRAQEQNAAAQMMLGTLGRGTDQMLAQEGMTSQERQQLAQLEVKRQELSQQDRQHDEEMALGWFDAGVGLLSDPSTKTVYASPPELKQGPEEMSSPASGGYSYGGAGDDMGASRDTGIGLYEKYGRPAPQYGLELDERESNVSSGGIKNDGGGGLMSMMAMASPPELKKAMREAGPEQTARARQQVAEEEWMPRQREYTMWDDPQAWRNTQADPKPRNPMAKRIGGDFESDPPRMRPEAWGSQAAGAAETMRLDQGRQRDAVMPRGDTRQASYGGFAPMERGNQPADYQSYTNTMRRHLGSAETNLDTGQRYYEGSDVPVPNYENRQLSPEDVQHYGGAGRDDRLYDAADAYNEQMNIQNQFGQGHMPETFRGGLNLQRAGDPEANWGLSGHMRRAGKEAEATAVGQEIDHYMRGTQAVDPGAEQAAYIPGAPIGGGAGAFQQAAQAMRQPYEREHEPEYPHPLRSDVGRPEPTEEQYKAEELRLLMEEQKEAEIYASPPEAKKDVSDYSDRRMAARRKYHGDREKLQGDAVGNFMGSGLLGKVYGIAKMHGDQERLKSRYRQDMADLKSKRAEHAARAPKGDSRPTDRYRFDERTEDMPGRPPPSARDESVELSDPRSKEIISELTRENAYMANLLQGRVQGGHAMAQRTRPMNQLMQKTPLIEYEYNDEAQQKWGMPPGRRLGTDAKRLSQAGPIGQGVTTTTADGLKMIKPDQGLGAALGMSAQAGRENSEQERRLRDLERAIYGREYQNG